MRVLVTGGAGFIGSHFVRTLLTRGYPGLTVSDVTVLDKLTYAGNRANLAGLDVRFVTGDVADVARVEQVLAGHDAVVHFAAESHVDRSIRESAVVTRTNVLGTQVLLDAAYRHQVTRFLHVSTDEVYGSIAVGSWDERSPVDPRSPYSASKAGSDLLALAYHRTHDLPVLVTRCSNNYGPYQHPEKLIPRFVTNLLDGLPVPLYGDGGNVREWLHVDDHCAGVAAVLAGGRPGEVYHVGGGTELTNRELTGLLLAACDAGWDRVEAVPDRKGHDRRYALDSTKIGTELGWRPRVDFTAGLAETVRWYRDNRTWWEPLR
ncbi:dTDP-glucose 4,6-dehydratase [Micromonospora yangpuensis]|uniref:dTDP-glucose 4,6-dehydratase n=1 Tax=Micromonospora yangpuensis TaxID=683228 RepID=A0A1C6UUN7_9ACTN|nr:dTDP-glucose 4,6-dehydratase [Micromonospora yangpuensis]GGM23899.1 dTDP-glucose 4,6-dehydratase [Micromonospora yangpuensis]SCL57762.1 dTDP-glucose 4,6-dehydratase [Micromonospora yangpuensis]